MSYFFFTYIRMYITSLSFNPHCWKWRHNQLEKESILFQLNVKREFFLDQLAIILTIQLYLDNIWKLILKLEGQRRKLFGYQLVFFFLALFSTEQYNFAQQIYRVSYFCFLSIYHRLYFWLCLIRFCDSHCNFTLSDG